MTKIARDAQDMISGMNPVLQEPVFVFCPVDEANLDWQALAPVGLFREQEATTLILDRTTAERHGFDVGMPMRQITLEVHSALDGVGLTAAVASALGKADIPCNVVAAFHHDHIFVPARLAEAALKTLLELQASAASGN